MFWKSTPAEFWYAHSFHSGNTEKKLQQASFDKFRSWVKGDIADSKTHRVQAEQFVDEFEKAREGFS